MLYRLGNGVEFEANYYRLPEQPQFSPEEFVSKFCVPNLLTTPDGTIRATGGTYGVD